MESRSAQHPWTPSSLRVNIPPVLVNISPPRPITRIGIKPVKNVKALVGTNSIYGVIEQSQRKSKDLLLRSPERGLGHIIQERVPKPGIKMKQLSLSANPYFPIHNPVFIPIGSEIFGVFVPCFLFGFLAWCTLFPEASFGQIIPDLADLEKMEVELQELSQVVIHALKRGEVTDMPPEIQNAIIEAENARNEGTPEAIRELKQSHQFVKAKTVIFLMGAAMLSAMLIDAAVKMAAS